MKNKKNRKLIVGIIIFLLLFSFILWHNKENINNYKEEKHKIKEVEKYEEISTSVVEDQIIKEYQKAFNNDKILGELSIPDTSLKVPVVQGSDNNYYLNHLLDKSYSILGSVFLDYRNSVDDRKILIYGHNSETLYTEFRFLENYINKDYYEGHKDIYFRTLNDMYHYKIFSVYIAKSDIRHVNLKLSYNEYVNHLTWLKEQSLYDIGEEVTDEDILILQTCYFKPKGSYLIIAAKKDR